MSEVRGQEVVSFSEQAWTAWVSLSLFSAAGFYILYGATQGSRRHSAPRVVLGIVTLLLAGTYALNLTGAVHADTVAAWRRGISWTLAAALIATTYTGLRFVRKVEQIGTTLEEAVQADGERVLTDERKDRSGE